MPNLFTKLFRKIFPDRSYPDPRDLAFRYEGKKLWQILKNHDRYNIYVIQSGSNQVLKVVIHLETALLYCNIYKNRCMTTSYIRTRSKPAFRKKIK